MTTDRLSAALADRYHIERELGQGGMATVYLAHDLKHDRDVAIKVLHPDLGAALGAERFLAEIRTTARLQHPHILPLLDSGAADSLLYYVMPLVTGETLRARLERERQLPIDDAVVIAREVADALGYAHGLGVIHRDIKPENILLQGGHALVADFGIALAVQSAGGARMTQTGLSLGTPQYMSPEQAMGERTIDARSDIYALGAVTYEMLVGEPPFTGPTVQAIVAKVMTERPTPLRVIRDTVPPGVEHAVLTALAKLPADRFTTAAEFATAMRGGATIAGGTPQSWRSAAPPGRERGNGLRIAALAVPLVLAGVLLGLLAARHWQSKPPATAAVTATSILPPAGGAFGEMRSLALAPDGRRLAFVLAASDGSRSLWVRTLDRLDAEQVPHSTGANAPFWSPDGRSLGYFAGGSLVVFDQNGETRKVCPVTGPTGGSWSRPGVILFGDRDGLSTVSAAGGPCKLIVPRDSGPPLKGLFLPDGKRFLMSRGGQLDMEAADLDGKVIATLPVRTLEFSVVAPGYLISASQSDAVALDAQRLNLNSLALEGPVARLASDVRSQGGIQTFTASTNGVLAFLPGGADRPYLVYDGNGLLRDTVRVDGTWSLHVRPSHAGPATVALAGNTVGIWLYDLDANRATRILVHDSTFPTTGYKFGTTFPVFSPDGQHLAYSMIGPGRCRIVDRDLGTNAERVVGPVVVSRGDKNECRYPLDWSPDGRSLLVRQDSTLRIIPVDGVLPEQVIVRPGRVPEGRLSPDGRSIAFTSEETGRAEVYVQALRAGAPQRVSRDGGRWAAWSHDGRRLTYITPDGRVQVAEIGAPGGTPGTPRTLFSVPTWRRSTFDDNGTGFAMVGDGERYLLRQSATGLAVAYVQQWPMLLQHSDSSVHSGTP